MDHSTITDNSGRKADFRNVIIIMTTNAGARELASHSIGFVSSKKGKDQTAITKLFAPEFRNRLDAIVSFSSLDHAATELVVDKLIKELEGQLAEKRVTIKLSPQARTYLSKKGFDPDYGARPLRRLIMKEIGDSLTEEILFGKLAKGGEAAVDEQDGSLVFAYSKE
jgi:ATP-dependent Clp protease ATP-binding subunit ClpA